MSELRRHVWTKRRWNGLGNPTQCCVNCGFMKYTDRRLPAATRRTHYIDVRSKDGPEFDVGYRPCDGVGPPEGLVIKSMLARHGVAVETQYYLRDDGSLRVRLDVSARDAKWIEDLLAGRLARR